MHKKENISDEINGAIERALHVTKLQADAYHSLAF